MLCDTTRIRLAPKVSLSNDYEVGSHKCFEQCSCVFA